MGVTGAVLRLRFTLKETEFSPMEQHPHRRPTPCTAQSRAEQLRTAQPQATRTVHVVENFDNFAGNAETLPVLMYHYVYTEDDPPEKNDANYLLDTKLAAQLQYLVDNNYYYPSYAEVRAFAQGAHTLPARSVVLTFDDGQKGVIIASSSDGMMLDTLAPAIEPIIPLPPMMAPGFTSTSCSR